MSECGYIDCCPVPEKDKRIKELEVELLASKATYLAVTNADDLAEFDSLNRRIKKLEAQVKTAHREGWLAATANVRKTLELDQNKWLWMDTDDE